MSCHIFSYILLKTSLHSLTSLLFRISFGKVMKYSLGFCWPKLIASKMAEALCTYFIRQSGVSVAAERHKRHHITAE